MHTVKPRPSIDFPTRGRAGPHNLPCELTSFLGRERELAEVKDLLGTTRLLTLTGAAGIGKTRLALRVAEKLVPAYTDGVKLAELAGVSEPAQVPEAVASALGLREQPGRPLAAGLIGYLRPKQLLLVLDNCEHLVEACATLAEDLLRACPDGRILVTSRQALGITGETTWRVPSLSLPDIQRLPPVEHLLRHGAVRLFVERAAAARPGFSLAVRNAHRGAS